MRNWSILLLFTSLIILIDTQENAYTSVESITSALRLDRKISKFLKLNLKVLDEYRALVQKYLDEQEMMLLDYPDEKSENFDELNLDSKLAGNPLIAFQAIRRITVDVNTLSTRLNILADDLDELVENDVKANEIVKVTYNEDMLGAATAILRLQATYHMAASHLVEGRIKHLNTSCRLTVTDCLLLAQTAKDMKGLDYYVEWREQAHFLCKRLECEDSRAGGCCQLTETLLMEATLEHEETRSLFVKKLKKDPSYVMESHVFPKKLKEVPAVEQRLTIIEKKLHGKKNRNSLCFTTNELLNEDERSKLSCYYLKNPDDPFVTLQRFKMEVQSRTPSITTIHNAISVEEADMIQKLAKPVLSRSMVVGDYEEFGVTSEERISQTGWLGDHRSPLGNISKRIAGITGLATKFDNSEPFQVVNYGIGGLFGAHYDALDTTEEFEKKLLNESDYMGNRIMTFILYLSDVELGGATYFPNANVSVYPKKGSATMWYNLDDAGNLDENTLHGGCPVLFGSKWIANKWIMERGQLFRKPCLVKTPSGT